MQYAVEHHVAAAADSPRQPFLFQVLHRGLRGTEQPPRNMVGEHAVLFLGHPAVVRTQPGFHMGYRDMHFGSGQRTGQGRVGIAVHQDNPGLFFQDNVLDFDEHLPGLTAVGPAADPKLIGRTGDPQFFKKHIGHIRVVMLAGMHQHFPASGLGQRGRHHRRLNKLRAGPHNRYHFHCNLPPVTA